MDDPGSVIIIATLTIKFSSHSIFVPGMMFQSQIFTSSCWFQVFISSLYNSMIDIIKILYRLMFQIGISFPEHQYNVKISDGVAI